MNPDTTSIAGYSKTVGADAEVFLDAEQKPVAVSEEHPLPVKIVSGLELEFKNDQGNPLPVTGPLTDTQLRATAVPVSGTVSVSNQPTSMSVSNFPATQPVSGSVTVSNLPTSTEISNDVGNPVPVSGTVTANVSIPAAFVAGQIRIAVTGTAVQLPSNALTQGVMISSASGNAENTTIGTSSALNNLTNGTGNGAILYRGSTKSIAVTNTDRIWINGTAGDIVNFIGS
jgi:hypothetical protein